MKEISIIGAGVAGLCVARHLMDRGASITLIDRHINPGAHACSWWAGGMLAPYCEGESAEELVTRLGLEAAAWWRSKTHSVSQNGTLVISPARDKSDLSRFARSTKRHRKLSGEEISSLEPDLDKRFATGLFFEDEAHLDPRAALMELRENLQADGAHFVQEDADPATYAKLGLTIDCRGLHAKNQTPDLRGVLGEMLILYCPDIELQRPIRMLHPRIPIYIVPRGGGKFMLGATMIERSIGQHVTARSMLELLSAAYALHPAFAEAEILEMGVDCRPAFPDNLPRIQRQGNLIRANGLYRHGFLLAPALGRMVAEHVFDHQKPEVMHEAAA